MLVTLAIHFSGRDGAPSSSSSNYSSTPAAISAEDGPSAYYLSRVSEGGAGLVGNDNADDDDEFGDVDDNRGGGGGGHRAKGGGRGGFGREKGDVSSPLELPAGCPVLENRAPDFGGDEYLPNEVEVVVVASRGAERPRGPPWPGEGAGRVWALEGWGKGANQQVALSKLPPRLPVRVPKCHLLLQKCHLGPRRLRGGRPPWRVTGALMGREWHISGALIGH